MNPILASDGRRRMRSWRTPIILTVFGVLMLMFCYLTQLQQLTRSDIYLHDMRAGVTGYAALLLLQFALIILVAPLMTAGSIAGERERQTLDLMLVTSTGSLRIVLGKLMESFFFLAILIVSVMPISCSALLYGNIDLVRIGVSTLFMLVTAFAALSIGMVCSVLFKRTATAAIMAYLVLLGIGIFTLVPLMFWSVTQDVVTDAANGVIDVRALIMMIPLSVWFNPGIGLFTLISTQTGMFDSVLRNYSVRLGSAVSLLSDWGLGNFVWLNMAAMVVLATALVLLSALLVRPRSHKRHRRAQKA